MAWFVPGLVLISPISLVFNENVFTEKLVLSCDATHLLTNKTQHWSCHLQPLRVYFNIQYNLIQWLFTILSFFDGTTETIKKQNSKQWIYNDDTSKLI